MITDLEFSQLYIGYLVQSKPPERLVPPKLDASILEIFSLSGFLKQS